MKTLQVSYFNDALCMYQCVVNYTDNWRVVKTVSLSNIVFSAGLGQALVESGWMMLAVLGVNHAFSPAQTGELGLTTVPTLKMWQFIVLVLVSLDKAPTAAVQVSLGYITIIPPSS